MEDPHSSTEAAIEGFLAGAGNRLRREGAHIPVGRGRGRGAKVADGLEGIPHEGCPLTSLIEEEAVEYNLADSTGGLVRGGGARGSTGVT